MKEKIKDIRKPFTIRLNNLETELVIKTARKKGIAKHTLARQLIMSGIESD